jgi:hypothetical protein
MECAVRIALATVLAAVAVLAALLARDVHAWRNALAQGDAVFAVTPNRATWAPSTLFGGAAASLLGTSDDLAYRRALQLYARTVSTPNRLDTAVERAALQSQAENALNRIAHGPHASQADTLLGVLAFDMTTGADASLGDFAGAVRADPGNAAAKFDLELLLRLTAAQGTRTGAGPGGTFGRGGRRGAGGGVPGNGY